MLRVYCVCLVLWASAAHGDTHAIVEKQASFQRREQIESLKKISALTADRKELSALLFRLGELYWEESKFYAFEAQNRADEGKTELLTRQKQYGQLALAQYARIIQEHPDFERSDEVLFFFGTYLMEDGQDRKALVVFKRLVENHPKSKYIPDAYLAFGEYYFKNSQGKHADLEKALAAYKKVAQFPESQVYAFALYKQGWCYFNLGDYTHAKDTWKAVVLHGEQAGAVSLKRKEGSGYERVSSLVREARADYARAYAREGDVSLALEDFSKVAPHLDDRLAMMRTLANVYYGDGKDREAAIAYNTLIKEKPLSPEAPGFQGRIVDIVLRMGDKGRTVTQVRRLVKIMKEVEGSGVIQEDKDKKVFEEAKNLAERTLSNLAITWHDEAKKTREKTVAAYADMISSDYLTLFPKGSRAPELLKLRQELHGPSPVEPGATAQTPPQPLPLEKAGEQEFVAAGRLGMEEIRSVIRSHAPEIRDCYQASMTRHPMFEAKVVVKFTIQGTGSVVSSEIAESTVRYEDMESCLTERIKDWRFPAFSGGGTVLVKYPFFFRPGPTHAEQQP